jgi:hypothetical protein
LPDRHAEGVSPVALDLGDFYHDTTHAREGPRACGENVAAFEVKLSAQSAVALAVVALAVVALAVVVATGLSYRRADGVNVVSITTLGR